MADLGVSERPSTITRDTFNYFQKLVNDRVGIQLEGKAYLAESRLQNLVHQLDMRDAQALIEKMRAGDRALANAAVEAMTTNETSFFRDAHPFETLATDVLPGLVERRRGGKIRIWSGASSSGQEPYSLAMILHEKFPDRADPSRVEIIATDVSAEMVERTADATYSRFEVNRGLSASLSQKYFELDGRKFRAKPTLRKLITTRELNLLGPWTGIPRCDVVVLRNVLIYFTPEVKRDILRRIRTDVLHPDGCLVLGASETTVGIDDTYKPTKVGRTNIYFL